MSEPILWVIWDITVADSAGADVVIRISSRGWTIPSGGDQGESYSPDWSNVEAWEFTESGYDLQPDGVLAVGGALYRKTQDINTTNPALPTNAGKYDYLFDSTYALVDGTVVGQYCFKQPGAVPVVADFATFYNGRIRERPVNKDDSIRWIVEPKMAEADASFALHRYQGLGGKVEMSTQDMSSAAGVAPTFLGGDFTAQWYLSCADTTGGSPNSQELFSIQDSGDEVLVGILRDNADDLKLFMRYAPGLADDYVIVDMVSGTDEDDFKWVTVIWDEGNMELTVYDGTTKVVDATTILNVSNGGGAEDHIVIGNSANGHTFGLGCARIWSSILTEDEVFARIGPLVPEDETNLQLALEMADRFSTVATDESGNELHCTLTASTAWASTLTGEASLAGSPIPVALGRVFAAPVRMIDTALDIAEVAATIGDVTHLYSQGVALALDWVEAGGTYYFDDALRTFRETGLAAGTRYGSKWVPSQRIAISSTTSGDYDSTVEVEKVTPTPFRSHREGTTERFTVKVADDAGFKSWASAGSSTASVRTPSGENDWTILDGNLFDSPYYAAGNLNRWFLTFSQAAPAGLVADVVGDPTMLADEGSPPAGYYSPPEYVANVLRQIAVSYGPEWSDATMPAQSLTLVDIKVGYLVSEETTARTVMDVLSKSALTWVVEADAGTFSVVEYQHPDDASSAGSIVAAQIINATSLRSRSAPSVVRTSYAKTWAPVPATEVPEVVDDEIREWISEEWRYVRWPMDATAAATTPEGTYLTHVTRRKDALAVCKKVYALSQGKLIRLTVRADLAEQLAYAVGQEWAITWPRLSLAATPGIIVERTVRPAAEAMGLIVWIP